MGGGEAGTTRAGESMGDRTGGVRPLRTAAGVAPGRTAERGGGVLVRMGHLREVRARA